MASPKGSARLGWLALDFQGDVRTFVVPHGHFVPVLVAARALHFLHLRTNRGRVRKRMKLALVGEAANLQRLVQHGDNFELRFDDFSGLRGRGGLSAGSFGSESREERAGERERSSEEKGANLIALHQA